MSPKEHVKLTPISSYEINITSKHAPAIGFAVVIDQLLAALSRQKIEILTDNDQVLIVYAKAKQKEAIEHAIALRQQGTGAVLAAWEDGKEEHDHLVPLQGRTLTLIPH